MPGMTAERWNELYPAGTPVKYYPVAGRDDHTTSKTRGEAWTLDSGHHVVTIDGKSGGVALSHLKVVSEKVS